MAESESSPIGGDVAARAFHGDLEALSRHAWSRYLIDEIHAGGFAIADNNRVEVTAELFLKVVSGHTEHRAQYQSICRRLLRGELSPRVVETAVRDLIGTVDAGRPLPNHPAASLNGFIRTGQSAWEGSAGQREEEAIRATNLAASPNSRARKGLGASRRDMYHYLSFAGGDHGPRHKEEERIAKGAAAMAHFLDDEAAIGHYERGFREVFGRGEFTLDRIRKALNLASKSVDRAETFNTVLAGLVDKARARQPSSDGIIYDRDRFAEEIRGASL